MDEASDEFRLVTVNNLSNCKIFEEEKPHENVCMSHGRHEKPKRTKVPIFEGGSTPPRRSYFDNSSSEASSRDEDCESE